MFRNLRAIITTWPFVLSLLVLLTNDAWLKWAYPGLVSGKLSDFAGVAAVGFLLLSAYPKHRRVVCVGIVAAFAWWKSPLSQPTIDAINSRLSFQVGRTIDYTDLVGLIVLPLCIAVTSRPVEFALPGRILRRLLFAPVLALTALGLMATSIIPTRHNYQIRAPAQAPDLDRAAIAATVADVATQHGLECQDCANRISNAYYAGNGVYLKYEFTGAKTVTFSVEAFPDGLFIGDSGQQKADRIRTDLKSRLASSYEDLEYVEQLNRKTEKRQ